MQHINGNYTLSIKPKSFRDSWGLTTDSSNFKNPLSEKLIKLQGDIDSSIINWSEIENLQTNVSNEQRGNLNHYYQKGKKKEPIPI